MVHIGAMFNRIFETFFFSFCFTFCVIFFRSKLLGSAKEKRKKDKTSPVKVCKAAKSWNLCNIFCGFILEALSMQKHLAAKNLQQQIYGKKLYWWRLGGSRGGSWTAILCHGASVVLLEKIVKTSVPTPCKLYSSLFHSLNLFFSSTNFAFSGM